MPTFTVPASYGTLREFNKCHNPAGSSAGGQFCSDDDLAGPDAEGYQSGYPEAQASALASARSAMMHRSFEQSDVIETMSVVNTKGVYVGPMLEGDENSVYLPEEVWSKWIDSGPVVTAHTHPRSGTFSFDDFAIHNKVNRVGAGVRRDPTVTAMQVYGEDGSWYEIKFERVLNGPEMARLEAAFTLKRSEAARQSQVATTKWAKEQSWWATRPPKTWDLMTEVEHVRHAAEKAGALKTLEDHHTRAFRDKAQYIWTSLAAQIGGFSYRYHLAD